MRLTFVDPRNGKSITFASAKALDDYVSGLVREQKRLVSGKTLKPKVQGDIPNGVGAGLPHGIGHTLRKGIKDGRTEILWG